MLKNLAIVGAVAVVGYLLVTHFAGGGPGGGGGGERRKSTAEELAETAGSIAGTIERIRNLF
jgi:hypothetical protein